MTDIENMPSIFLMESEFLMKSFSELLLEIQLLLRGRVNNTELIGGLLLQQGSMIKVIQIINEQD